MQKISTMTDFQKDVLAFQKNIAFFPYPIPHIHDLQIAIGALQHMKMDKERPSFVTEHSIDQALFLLHNLPNDTNERLLKLSELILTFPPLDPQNSFFKKALQTYGLALMNLLYNDPLNAHYYNVAITALEEMKKTDRDIDIQPIQEKLTEIKKGPLNASLRLEQLDELIVWSRTHHENHL